ncbi:hypothetical protein QRX60_48790 [Amycolatopsis mongoliensis]|uniref:P68 RBP/TagC-like beta-propeller domain-containing protein n=1 Tax=Amycolatopsis mongoliensis TaxID=715475 RepID=A0A9Y2JQ56_9PSEU|nr:hypothetical protein [Amycolatopsis sp. 4-36]WIY01825.1 hypothetical protein QRX60_48790 [Amycolatopsis sp. 4-36]
MQGFAFDNVNRRLFVVQARNGTSGDDLCVNQLGFGGEVLGSMHLGHAGHGVSIGVQPVGTALARFKFVDGGTSSVKKPPDRRAPQ